MWSSSTSCIPSIGAGKAEGVDGRRPIMLKPDAGARRVAHASARQRSTNIVKHRGEGCGALARRFQPVFVWRTDAGRYDRDSARSQVDKLRVSITEYGSPIQRDRGRGNAVESLHRRSLPARQGDRSARRSGQPSSASKMQTRLPQPDRAEFDGASRDASDSKIEQPGDAEGELTLPREERPGRHWKSELAELEDAERRIDEGTSGSAEKNRLLERRRPHQAAQLEGLRLEHRQGRRRGATSDLQRGGRDSAYGRIPAAAA